MSRDAHMLKENALSCISEKDAGTYNNMGANWWMNRDAHMLKENAFS